ncbi:MAG: tRNA lysidine(34) synthetase TilS [Lachnospiraceae bacterium]|nr:tRNA lysidine(34) synthetase TilS [Lachnospiraceae bacterium]
MDFLEKIRRFIEEEQLLAAGDGVLVALSGGADSVCLLLALTELAGPGGWQVRALHVHHGLRGPEADRDEGFVRELCGRLGVPLFVVHKDVAGYAREQGMSTEEAGRVLRYEALEAWGTAWAESIGAGPVRRVRIAVAHHQDDNVETILHHLLRGSGLRGLGGMAPVMGNRVRPLLCVRRQEITGFLKQRGQDWYEDSTNQSRDYTRNRIRGELIPYMRDHINGKAAENILRSGRMFAEADRYLAGQAEILWQEYGKTELLEAGGGPSAACGTGELPGETGTQPQFPRCSRRAQIPCSLFLAQDPVIRSYLVRRMLDAAAPGQKNVTARHFRQIEELAGKSSGSRCDLPGALIARRDYGYLVVEQVSLPCPVPDIILPVPLPGTGQIQAGNLKIKAFFREKAEEIPKNQYTKWFDYDKIKDTLSVRPWREGDYLILKGGGHKRISRFLIDQKISRDLRQHVRVLAEGAHVLWVIGYRISEYYKITDHTQAVLQAEWNGGETDGREDTGPADGRRGEPENQ